ncbi:filamentous hemagglutinin N-terminal domain-containing protein [Calothrix sp. FACHB-156]|nr:filamentous hemagglutinin N-terminal domain-containing protein [Calothrix sp. FACHB-156]
MKKYSIAKLKRLVSISSLLFAASVIADGLQTVGKAQITATPNDARTVISRDGNTINITGGTKAQGNLFHSFEKFGVNADQTANFISNPSIQNILGRVTGGDASVINGLIQVTGGNSNLYLMNPAGIIFGSGARLDVPGSFTATTANGIRFGDQWFNASGQNNYAALVGNPNAFAFTMSEPGAIINAGKLEVGEGKDLTLLGGTVANTGELKSSGGNITVAAIPGEKLVRISQKGNILSLDVQQPLNNDTLPTNWNLPISTLPKLLTGGNVGNATGIQVNDNGTVSLTGSGIKIESGDIVSSGTINASGSSSGDIKLLADNTVQIRDTLLVKADGDLYIQGKEAININALKNPLSWFQSGGNLSLVSDGVITSNGRFATGGDFSARKLSGEPTNFNITSINSNGIISSQGDVTFGNYEGVALKVEAQGSITATGNIKITGSNSSILSGIDANQPVLAQDQDIPILANSSALILRAGVTQLQNSPNISNQPITGKNFTSTVNQPSVGNITVNGDITTNKGPVILSAKGNITTKNITTGGTFYRRQDDQSLYNAYRGFLGGYVNLTADGNITIETINAYGLTNSTGGDIEIKASGNFQATGSFLTFLRVEEKYRPQGFERNNLVPTSILTGSSPFGNPLGVINIQHGGTYFVIGPQFQKDSRTQQVIYQLVQENPNGNIIIGPDSEQRVSFTGIKVYPQGDANSFVFRDSETNNIYAPIYRNGSNLINVAPITIPLTLNKLPNPNSTSFTAGAIASTSGGNGYMPFSVRDLPLNTNFSGLQEYETPVQINFTPPPSKVTNPVTGNIISGSGADNIAGNNSSGIQSNTGINNGGVNNPPQNTPINNSSPTVSTSNGSTSSNVTQGSRTDRGVVNNAPIEEIQQNAQVNLSSAPSSDAAGLTVDENFTNGTQECNATQMKPNSDRTIELTGSCVPKKIGNSSQLPSK